MKTVKIYGLKPTKVHTPQGWITFSEYSKNGTHGKIDMYEYFYSEYLEDGRYLSCGNEDFSVERMQSAGMSRKVYNKVKDSGEKYPSGKTRWDNLGSYGFTVKKQDARLAVRMMKHEFHCNGIELR